FLKMPGKFREIGARLPKAVLLVGPPGTGKTLIARAVAGEAGVPFMSITGSDFMEMFVGVGAARVRDLFQTARKQAPCIIFVDEIDSIGRKRGAGLGGGHDEREQTLNQMLSEMDGFETTEGIVMMAATNRPDILDSALLRPGRFDRQIVVPLPTQSERREILEVHSKDKRIGPDVDLVHKVTILPTGMALGVTQQLPLEEKHIYRQDYIEDSLVVRLGGRLAEEAVYETLSTGANNDLVGCTELARKMVREWGMSNRI